MRLLLDTHVLIWWLGDMSRLGPAARKLIDDPDNHLFFSPASPWEMAIKVGIGKLRVDIAEAMDAFAAAGFAQLDIAPAHLVSLTRLERLHGDPFDRLLIAQALVEGATIMTDDGAIARYPVATVRCA